jgi:hypothetical protein
MNYYLPTSLRFLFIILLSSVSVSGWAGTLPGSLWIATPEETRALGLQPLNLGNGKVFMPRHDGVHYFIDPTDAPVAEGERPSVTEIESAVALAKKVSVAKGTVIGGNLMAQSLATLPMTLDIDNGAGMKAGESVSYGITIMSMTFRPSGILLTIGIKFKLPGQYDGQEQFIYLGAKNLSIPYQGGTLSGDLLLIETGNLLKNVYLGEKVFFELGPKTSLGFDCGKLKDFHLNGRVTLPQTILVPEDEKGNVLPGRVSFLIDVDIPDWNNVYIAINLSSGGFRLPVTKSDFSENAPLVLGFQPIKANASPDAENIVLDLSSHQSPVELNKISCFSGAGNDWRGIYIQDMSLRLPPIFKSKDAASNLFVDVHNLAIGEGGFFASVSANNLIPIEQGRIGDGFDVSIENLALSVCNTDIKSFGITGALRLPIMKIGETLTYSYYQIPNAGTGFSIGLKSNQKGFTFDAFKANVSLCELVGQLAQDKNGETQVGVNLSGNLKIARDTDKLDLNFGFQNLSISSTYPFINSFMLTIGNTTSCGPSGTTPPATSQPQPINIAGMELSIGNLQVGMLNKVLQASADIAVNLDDKISGKGHFVVAGELAQDGNGRYFLNNTKLGVDEVRVKGDFSAFKFDGGISSINNPALGTGFSGNISFYLKLGDSTSAGGSVAALFARKDNFKYWFLDASMELSPSIPIAGPLSLKALNGAAYKNVSFQYADLKASPTGVGTTTSGLAFTPKEGTWGFRAGLLMDIKENATLGGMIEVVGQTGYGIKKVSLFADLQLALPNTQKPTMAELKAKMGAICASLDKYLDGETLGGNTSVKGDNYKGVAAGNKNLTMAALKNVDMFSTKSKESYTAGSRIGASVLISYKVDAHELIGLIYPDIHVGMNNSVADFSLKSTGYGIFYFSPKDWYIHLGKQAWDERLGLKLDAYAGTTSISAFVNGYFMLGSGIQELPVPRVPNEFASLFDTKTSSATLNERNLKGGQPYDEVKSGNGIALGAAAGLSINFSLAKIIQCNISAGAGFDVVVSNLANCPNQNGWGDASRKYSAQGQLYGYCLGELKVKSVSLAGFGAGFSLKASVPKPFMAEGRVKVFVKVWFIKADLTVKVKVGDMCDTRDLPPPIINYKFVEKTAPLDGATEVSPYANINVMYSDTIRSYSNDTGIRMSSSIEIYGPGNQKVYGGSQVMLTKDMGLANQAIVSFPLTTPLLPQTTYQVKVTSTLADNDGAIRNENDQPIQEVRTFTFKTGGNSRKIEKADVALYPVDDQSNIYRANWQGLLAVDATVVDKLRQACADCKYTLEIISPGWQNTFSTPITNLANQSFDLSGLAPNTQYSLRIVSQGTSQNGPQRAPTTSTLPVYEGHNFRTSQFATFQDKIAAYNARKTTEVVSPYGGIPVFNLSLSNELSKSDFEPFSKEEIAENLLFLTPQGDWFTQFNVAMTTTNWNGRPVAVDYWAKNPPNATYIQQRQPYLLAGVPKTESTSSAETGPVWKLNFFEKALYDYADAQPTLYNQEPNGIPIFDGTHRIPVNYDPLRKHPRLHGRLLAAQADLTFSSPNPIDLNTQQLTQYIIAVECRPDARDKQPVAFSINVLNSKREETTTLNEELKLTIKNPAWISASSSMETGVVEKEVIAIPTGTKSYTYTSTFESINGCPALLPGTAYALSIADPKKPFVARKYDLQVTNVPYPAYQPYITVACQAVASSLPSLYDNEIDSQLRATGQRNTYGSATNFQQTANNYYIKVTAYEDKYAFNFQTMKEPTQITLSNGRGCLIPAGKSECTITIPAEEYGTCSEVTAVASPAITPGPNEATLSKTRFYAVQVSNTFASLGEVCSAPTDHKLFAPQVPLNVGSQVQQDSGRAGISPVEGYYRLLESNQPGWVYIKDGKVTQKGSCSDKPYIKQVCVANPAYTPTNGASQFQLQLTLYTSNTQNQLFVPNYPIRVTLSNGQEQTIPVGTSGKITIDLTPGGSCAYLVSTFPDNGMSYNPITPSGCQTLPPAPTLSVSPGGLIGFGQTVTLTASGCSGEVIWVGMNTKGTSLSYTPRADSRLRAICIQNGCVSPESGIDLKLIPFTVASNLPGNEVCRTRTAVLTASGCGGTVTWQPGNLSGTTISVRPTETTTYSTSCVLADGTVRLGESITMRVNDTPNAPTLTSSIPAIRANEVCITANSVLLTASACNLGITSWYSALGTQTPALIANSGGQAAITVTPTKTTTYFVSCHTDKCEGDPSNSLTITVIDPPVPVINTDTYLNTICRSYSTTLSATNCPYTVVWSDGQQGNTVTVAPQTTTTYTASCTKDNWCSGIASSGITIKVVEQTALIPPVLSAKATEFCSYESTQLSISGAYTGKPEWTTPANGTWHAEGNYLTSLIAQHAAGNYVYQVRSNLNGCYRESNSVGLTVNPKPELPVLNTDKTNHTICFGDVINLSAACSLGSPVWDNIASTKLSGLSVGKHTYYALCKSVKNCIGDKASITITVNPIPAAPTITSSAGNPICAYDETTIAAINCAAGGVGGTISWKHDPKITISIEKVNTTSTYAANCTVLGCVSAYSSDYTLTVNPKPVKPGLTVSAASICSGTNKSITFTASGCSGTYKWSDGNTSRGASFTVSNPGTYSYWVKCVEKNCESDASDTQLSIINQTPGAFTIMPSVESLCTGSEVTLTAKDYSGTVRWVSESNITGELIKQNLASTHTYIAESVSDKGCVSPQANKKITVYPYPSAPGLTVSNSSICTGSNKSITFSASGCTGTYHWSDNHKSSSGDVSVSSAGTYTYNVSCIENGCEGGASATKSANVIQTANSVSMSSDKTNNKMCIGEMVTINVANCNTGGTVYWSDNVTGTSRSFAPESNTTYFAHCSTGNGCDGPNASIFIDVSLQPKKPEISLNGSIPSINKGDGITITATCETGDVVWTSPDNFNGGYHVPAATASYRAKCKVTDKCISDEQIQDLVVVCPTPTAPSIAVSEVTIKANETTGTLTVSGCGGSVKWSNNETGSSITVTPGDYTVTCTITNDCGSSNSSTASGSVKKEGCPTPTAPSISVTGITIGVNETAGTLTVDGCGSDGSILWSTGDTGTSITKAPGYYTVTCTTAKNYCENTSSSTAGAWITKGECPTPNAPSIAVDATIGPNETKGTLTVSGCGGSIKWSTGDTGSSITVVPGDYTVTCTVTNDCGSSNSSTAKGSLTVTPICSAPAITVDNISIASSGSGKLTAKGCTNGTITWGNGTTGVDLSVSEAGTYNATCAVNTDCGIKTSTASGKVTIIYDCNPPSVSVSDITIDEGATGTLTLIGCSGSATWSTGETGLSINVSKSGTYKATCTISTNCGNKSSSDEATVTVTPSKPKPSGNFAYTGKSILCDGESSTPGSFVGCDGTVEVGWKTGGIYTGNDLRPGEYYAICKVDGAKTTFGISSSSRPYNLSISKSPNVSSIESGQSITLSASANGANSYKWNTGSTASSISVNPTTTATYTVRAYSGNSQDGCESSSEARQTISVSVPCTNPPDQPSLTASVATICGSGNSALTASGCTNGTLSWSTGDGNTSSITVYNAGTYTVYCSTDNCPAKSATKSIAKANWPDISTNGSTLTATNCPWPMVWTKRSGSPSVEIQISTSSMATVNGGGLYEVKCANGCTGSYRANN